MARNTPKTLSNRSLRKNKKSEGYCHEWCPHRGLCVEKTQGAPPIKWCAGCKVKLFCMLAREDLVEIKVVCPYCGVKNILLFWKCLCGGASPNGRLAFVCSVCKEGVINLGSGTWSKGQ